MLEVFTALLHLAAAGLMLYVAVKVTDGIKLSREVTLGIKQAEPLVELMNNINNSLIRTVEFYAGYLEMPAEEQPDTLIKELHDEVTRQHLCQCALAKAIKERKGKVPHICVMRVIAEPGKPVSVDISRAGNAQQLEIPWYLIESLTESMKMQNDIDEALIGHMLHYI